MSGGHEPVLLAEVLTHLALPRVQRIVDGSVGLGGHAAALLQRLPEAELLGLDRDAEALAAAADVLREFGARVHLLHSRFSAMTAAVDELGWAGTVGAVLLDIGVSSLQIDTAARGFSFRRDGPLDMRMDRDDRVTAAVILNTWSEADLARLFREYGEEPRARQAARAVVARRAERAWSYTGELAELLEQVVSRPGRRDRQAVSRCFQALRLAVNDELGELERGLQAAVEVLAPGGRLAVITFHSLEDRIAKQFIRQEALECVCPPSCPVCICGKVARLAPLTRKPISAGAAEVARNPRAAPARLRLAERLTGERTRAARSPR
jgi:16S rRNA (cytosine1402-N4)-methyltransferase